MSILAWIIIGLVVGFAGVWLVIGESLADARASWFAVLCLVLGLTVLLAISLSSHAAALPSGTWLAVLLDWLHQVAAAAWVGGLFAFVSLLRLTSAEPDAATQRPLF